MNVYKGDNLDHALAAGYFRMGNDLFTTHQVSISKYGNSDIIDPVFWLRLNIKKVKETALTKKIWKKCADVSTSFLPPQLQKIQHWKIPDVNHQRVCQ